MLPARPRLAPDGDAAPERAEPGAVDATLQRIVLLDALAGVSPAHRGVVLLAVVLMIIWTMLRLVDIRREL